MIPGNLKERETSPPPTPLAYCSNGNKRTKDNESVMSIIAFKYTDLIEDIKYIRIANGKAEKYSNL